MVSYRRDPIYRPRVEDFIPATPARSIAQGLSSGLLKGVESGFDDFSRSKRAIDDFVLKSIMDKIAGSNVYEVTPGEDPIPTVRKYVRDNRIDMPALLESIKTGTPEYRQTVINELRALDIPDATIPDLVASYATKIADKDWHNIVAEPEKVDAAELLSRLQPLEDMLRDRVAQQPWVQSIDSDEKKKKAQSFLDEFLSTATEPDAAQLLQQPTEMVPLLQEAIRQKREELTDRLTKEQDTPALDEDIAGLVERLKNVSVNVPPVPVKKRQLSPGEIREYLSEYTSSGKIPKKFENIVIEPATAAGAKSARTYKVTVDGKIEDLGPSQTGSNLYMVPLMVRTPEGKYVPKKDDSGALMFVPSTKPEPEYKIEELSAEEQHTRVLDRAMQTEFGKTLLDQLLKTDRDKHITNLDVLQLIQELHGTLTDMTDAEWESVRGYVAKEAAAKSLRDVLGAVVNLAMPAVVNLNTPEGRALQKFGRYAGRITRMYERGVLTDEDVKRYVVSPKNFSRKNYLKLLEDDFADSYKKASKHITAARNLYKPLDKYTYPDDEGKAQSYVQLTLNQWEDELNAIKSDYEKQLENTNKQSPSTPTPKKKEPTPVE